MVNSRDIYWQYAMIRDCVNHKKCKRLPLSEVRRRVNEQLDFVISLSRLTEEEIHFAINYCEENFPAIV